MFDDEFIAWLKAKTEFSGLSISKVVAAELPRMNPEQATTIGVVIPEPVGVPTYGGGYAWRTTTVTINIFGRRLARVQSLTRSLLKYFDRFSGAVGTTKVISSFMSSQSYDPDLEDDIEISRISFDVTLE